MADLFQTTPQNVTLHLKAIFAEGEIPEEATCKDYLQVRQEGQRSVSRNLRPFSREEADRKAATEYEKFADRRRLAIEAAAEEESIKQLEVTAKKISQRKKT